MSWSADDFKETNNSWSADDFKEKPKQPKQIKKTNLPQSEKFGVNFSLNKILPKQEQKPIKETSLTMDDNTYENWLNEKGFNKNKLPSPNEADRYKKEYQSYIDKLPTPLQQQFFSDEKRYKENKSIRNAEAQLKNPINVFIGNLANAATLGIGGLFTKKNQEQQMNTRPLYTLQAQEAEQQGNIENYKAAQLGNLAGSVLPYAASSKLLSPITKPLVNKLGGGILGNVVEGAISGAVPDAIQSVVQNEGNLSKLPQDVLRGAVEGAVFDVSGGLLKKVKDIPTNQKLNTIDTRIDEYQSKGILPGQSIPGTRPPRPITELPKQSIQQPKTPLKPIEPLKQQSIPIIKNEPAKTKIEPIKPIETTTNNKALMDLEAQYKKNREIINNSMGLNYQEKNAKLKGLAMSYSAEKRKIIQGDSLKFVEGGLTPKELNTKLAKEESNYIGKNVTVEGKNATIVSNPFGKVKVAFEDGTTKTVEKELIKPKVTMEDRTLRSVGDRKITAYQYDNPELKENIQSYANYIKEYELNSGKNKSLETSEVVRKLKDTTKISYDDIRKALDNIVKDAGLENNANSKRVEMVIDEMLTNGFKTTDGDFFPPDKDYITKKSKIEGKEIKPQSNYLTAEEMPILNNEFVKPYKYNAEIETKIKSAPNNSDVGTLGDYLKGEKVRELYSPVLDTPIKVTDSKNIVNGALGNVNGKNTIIINKNTANIEDTILEEASHAMRETKGRSNLGLSGIDEAKFGQYDTLPYEKSAGKMVDYAKTLDMKIPGYSGENKNLKLIQSVKKSDQFDNQLKTSVKGEYEVKNNSQLIRDADALIKTDIERATRLAKSETINSDLSNEVSRQLIQKAQKEGRWNDAIELTELTAKKAMESGRAVQALSLWSKMTPEGMLKYAQQMIDKANAKFAKMNPREFEKIKQEYKKMGIDIKYYSLNPRQSQMAKIIQLTPGDAKYINDQMVKIGKMPDGRPKDIEMAKTLDYIAAKIPPSVLKKVSTLQTMAQLLNAKTAIRNITGNMGFQVLENLSDTLGTGIDKLIGTVTKERTKYLPSLPTQLKGLGKGFKLGLEDALLGIDTSAMKTQFDLPNRTFRKGFFGALEKAMNIELRATDQAFYQSAFDQSLKNQMKAKGISNINNATSEMLEQAHLDGLYRTFQDNNFLSNMFKNLKRILNNNKEFGFGDMILKYPKTPANLLMRGIDYSPLGIVKGLNHLRKNGFNQKNFVETLSRATTGTTLLGTGMLLYNTGIITGKNPKDKEAAALMRETGKGQYIINLSALKRFLMSGLNPEYAKTQDNDTMINYDWIQPGALPFTAGANISAQNKNGKVSPGEVFGALAYSLEAGIDTLAEQPLVQNATRFLRGYNSPTESFMGTFKDVPSSFIPTFVSQIRQMVDNTSRDTLSDQAYGTKEALNKVVNKIPGLSKTLPEKITTTGQTKENYQNNSNNWFNVLLNPAFTSQYDASPGVKMVLDLYERTGETKQFPREAPKVLTIRNKKYPLTKEQQAEIQKELGQNVMKALDNLKARPNDEQTIKVITKILDRETDRIEIKLKRDIVKNNKLTK